MYEVTLTASDMHVEIAEVKAQEYLDQVTVWLRANYPLVRYWLTKRKRHRLRHTQPSAAAS